MTEYFTDVAEDYFAAARKSTTKLSDTSTPEIAADAREVLGEINRDILSAIDQYESSTSRVVVKTFQIKK
jgi:hypothetical protein